MGFSGSGHFNTKQGTLDYAVQDLLMVHDSDAIQAIHQQSRAFETAVDDVTVLLRPWATKSAGFYDRSLGSQSRILQEFQLEKKVQ